MSDDEVEVDTPKINIELPVPVLNLGAKKQKDLSQVLSSVQKKNISLISKEFEELVQKTRNSPLRNRRTSAEEQHTSILVQDLSEKVEHHKTENTNLKDEVEKNKSEKVSAQQKKIKS